MPHPIEPSTLRILNAKGQTIGTGFLVSKTLAVTCVHVAFSASMDGENRIRVQFRDEKRPIFAKVLDEFFDIEIKDKAANRRPTSSSSHQSARQTSQTAI